MLKVFVDTASAKKEAQFVAQRIQSGSSTLKERGIDHCPSFFNVSLRRSGHKEALRAMKPRVLAYLWSALTASQRKVAQSLGRVPPDS